MFESWERGSEMKLVKNPYYWDKGEDGKPLPYLDGVTFEVIPDDATRILKLQSGDLDGAEFIPYARVGELQKAGWHRHGALPLDAGAVHHHEREARA